jgi:hypothetical protein
LTAGTTALGSATVSSAGVANFTVSEMANSQGAPTVISNSGR